MKMARTKHKCRTQAAADLLLERAVGSRPSGKEVGSHANLSGLDRTGGIAGPVLGPGGFFLRARPQVPPLKDGFRASSLKSQGQAWDGSRSHALCEGKVMDKHGQAQNYAIRTNENRSMGKPSLVYSYYIDLAIDATCPPNSLGLSLMKFCKHCCSAVERSRYRKNK